MSWKPRHFNSPQAFAPPNATTNLQNGISKHEFEPISKSTTLTNSSALRRLHEHENSASIRKEVLWPPPHEDSDSIDEYQNDIYLQNSQAYNNAHHTKTSRTFQPPPTTIPLRTSPPITQTSAPVFKAQPVTDSYRGGTRMRGDQKWPPPECKEQMEAERQAQLELARGPVHKPRKVKKDYTTFFAKNSLPNNYPGYKAPPGTQHYYEDGTSDY